MKIFSSYENITSPKASSSISIEISQYLKFDFYYNNETYHNELGLNITSSPDLPKQKIAMYSISQKPYSAYAQLSNLTKMSLWKVFLHKG